MRFTRGQFKNYIERELGIRFPLGRGDEIYIPRNQDDDEFSWIADDIFQQPTINHPRHGLLLVHWWKAGETVTNMIAGEEASFNTAAFQMSEPYWENFFQILELVAPDFKFIHYTKILNLSTTFFVEVGDCYIVRHGVRYISIDILYDQLVQFHSFR